MSATVVSTVNGKVKGKLVDLKLKDSKFVHTFRNIPFAKSPVGSLRFMPPQPADPWDGIRDGTVAGNLPMYPRVIDEVMKQYILLPDTCESEINVDEDCLHVSVYTPHPEKGKKLPVMVWLYGGGFSMGCERLYDGSMLAGMNDVVVVVPNYRVGIFGFFSLGPKSICPGNAGLLDQQLALKWVQENIGVFGGDKNNVTIFGESAGAISVNFHLLSPLSRGLFHKAISHSGQAIVKGLFHSAENNRLKIQKCVEHLNIDEKDDCMILEAMQKIPAIDLVNKSMEMSQKKISFMPTFDDNFFPKSPEEIIKDKEFAKVPYIIGCNSSEGHGILSLFVAPNFITGMAEADEVYKALYLPLSEEGFEKCKEFYLKDTQDEKRFSKLMGNISGDAMFVAPAVRIAATHSEAGLPTYFYYGNFHLKLFHDKKYGEENGARPDWCVCDHSDDILMTFGIPFSINKLPLGTKYTDKEKEMSREFMKYLTNFAKTGDPNKGQKINTKWPKHLPKGKHLIVDTTYKIGKNLAEKEADFWNKVMPPYMTE